jgi:hypothetical protein
MKNVAPLLLAAVGLQLFLTESAAARAQTLQAVPAPNAPPADDTAKFLAGMPVPKNSPLAPLTNDPAFQEHAGYFEKAFAKLDVRQLAKLHAWQKTYLPESRESFPVAYYMFSGPDFLYLDQFFPDAQVYIMCGKEAMGPPPDPLRIANLSAAFHNLETAMHDSLATTYFITKEMKVDLQQQNLSGTIPILYVFLARAGKTITDVAFVSLGENGGLREGHGGGIPGVRITFQDGGRGRSQTLYYFTTDISDGGIAGNPGFMKFCDHFGVGASFLKSSSYLMFGDGFARVRKFILDHSTIIVQDDSGIPVSHFSSAKWNLKLFGTYVGPIELFREHQQSDLTKLFEQNPAQPLTIGFGYQWNYHKSNLIVAERK